MYDYSFLLDRLHYDDSRQMSKSWQESLDWLRQHPMAKPNGWEGINLFAMPLPIDLDPSEWTYRPWEGGGVEGDMWVIGESGYALVQPDKGDPFIVRLGDSVVIAP